MDEFLAQVTPAWLTRVLRAHGHLPRGRVARIEMVRTSETLPSRHDQLVATYSPGAPPTAPTHLFLKLAKPETSSAAARETLFYTAIAPRMPAIPLVPCYGAGITAAGTPYLLLADVSATHAPWDNGSPPRPHLEAIVSVLAQLHASWWERPDLGTTLGEHPEEALAAMFAQADERYAELADRLGDRLAAGHRRVLERYLAHAPALFRERLHSGRALTLCRPDNHHANFLFPRQPGGPVYIVDWHVYRCWWGPSDLAALVTRSLSPDQQHLGEALLRGYYARLVEHGVMGYPWEACRRDYRLGVIDTLRVVLSFRRHPARAMQTLTTIMQEFERQGCAELLG